VRKAALLVLALAGMSVEAMASGVELVYDPALHTQTWADQIANYTKQCAQYLKQCDQWIEEHTTALKEIQQVENEVLQLERMGDPKSYGMGLPGVSNITALVSIYGQAQKDFSDITGMANPQNLKVGWQQIQSMYGQNSWNGFDTAGGWHVGPATGLINFYASNYNVGYSTQQTIQQLNAKKLELTQQRDAAIAQMQSASDQSAVQKQQAIITALNGAIADVNGSIAQAISTANLQITQNQQAQAISENIAAQRQTAGVLQSVDQDVMALPITGVHQTIHWGQ
jgi:hypothetical protein